MLSRGTSTHDRWFSEQQALVNSASEKELAGLRDRFDNDFESVCGKLQSAYGVNIMKDAKKMMESPEIMAEYKTELLEPVLKELRDYEGATTAEEREHMKIVAEQLEQAWDASAQSFLIQESYNVANYLPLSTLDFPALIKQYIKFLGKEIIPVQTASSVNIEQRIFIKYLVNNNTGEEYETPKIYFEKDPATGAPLWKKLWNAGKGLRLNEKKVLTLATIQAATNNKYSLFNWLMDDDGNPTTETPNIRSRIAYDFGIKYVMISGKKVMLPKNGIGINIQTGGTFLNGTITADMKLTVVDPDTNRPTGEILTGVSDHLSGLIDFVKGTITASACGTITGIYVSGHVSNETNLRTIGFREYPEIRKFTIDDGCRFQLPFTVEDFAEANSSLNFNLYNRLVQELVGAQEMFEDESILQFLDEEFNTYDGAETDIWALESYTATQFVDLDPASWVPNYAGDPFAFRTSVIHNGLTSLIYSLCDRGKLDNLGFVIYANPKVTRLLKEFATWTVKQGADIGGVKMNHTFGLLTDTDVPIRVVASNRVPDMIAIPAYQSGTQQGDMSREYFFKIIGYPMDKFHISYKHLRFARHLTNSPENAAYQDVNSPGGAAIIVTTSSQYKTIAVQGIQARLICLNTKKMAPDDTAGLVSNVSPTPVDPTTGYTVLTSEPADWATKYGDYFMLNTAGTAMVPVTAVAPEFNTSKFYFTAATGGTAITEEPADWATTFDTYYVADTEEGERTLVAGVAPTFAANTYYEAE